MKSTWISGSRAPRIAALIMAALPTFLMWAASMAPRYSEEATFGWFAYTPLSLDFLMVVMDVLSWSMTLIQLAVPALIAVVPLLFVRRWTAFTAGMVLLLGGIVMGGFRLALGDAPAAVMPGAEFSPMYAALLLYACYLVAAALLFVATARLTPAQAPAPATAPEATAPSTDAPEHGED